MPTRTHMHATLHCFPGSKAPTASENRSAEVSEVKPEEFLERSNGPVCLGMCTDEGFHYENHICGRQQLRPQGRRCADSPSVASSNCRRTLKQPPGVLNYPAGLHL